MASVHTDTQQQRRQPGLLVAPHERGDPRSGSEEFTAQQAEAPNNANFTNTPPEKPQRLEAVRGARCIYQRLSLTR